MAEVSTPHPLDTPQLLTYLQRLWRQLQVIPAGHESGVGSSPTPFITSYFCWREACCIVDGVGLERRRNLFLTLVRRRKAGQVSCVCAHQHHFIRLQQHHQGLLLDSARQEGGGYFLQACHLRYHTVGYLSVQEGDLASSWTPPARMCG